MKVLWLIPLLALMSCGELPAVIADETKPAENQTLPVQTEQRVHTKEDYEYEEGLGKITEVMNTINKRKMSLVEHCNLPDKRVEVMKNSVKIGVVDCDFKGHIEVYTATGEVEYPVENCRHNGKNVEFTHFVFSEEPNGNLKMKSDGGVMTPIFVCAEVDLLNENLPQKTETLSLSNFIGDYSVFGECPKHDWNTGILSLSEDYISLTETGCKILSAVPIDSESLLLNLTACHAEGDAMPDERAKLTKIGDKKTLQYLPNDDGNLNRSGKVFELTPCTREVRD